MKNIYYLIQNLQLEKTVKKNDWSNPNEYGEIVQISASKIKNDKIISKYLTNLKGITMIK